MERQLENEKAALLERKRREQAEQRRKQAELERILEENRRKVHGRALCCMTGLSVMSASYVAPHAGGCGPQDCCQ